ncbi:MAG: hypothetical protein ACI9R3_005981, partial [Verrucomicrobiales bacterium]
PAHLAVSPLSSDALLHSLEKEATKGFSTSLKFLKKIPPSLRSE